MKSFSFDLPLRLRHITTFSAEVFTPSMIDDVEIILSNPLLSSNSFIWIWLRER
ncbi:MAG: hypothetical protein GF311_27760 [Candidatus Lokiarchaeota archaeon]|nr:hypothetical protein [Candidatus Lokiarchaeota archaeon]